MSDPTGRGSIFLTGGVAALTPVHKATFFFADSRFCIKLVDYDEYCRTPFAQRCFFTTYGILARPYHPSLVDILYKPDQFLPVPIIPSSIASPGDCDIEGNEWDFEDSPHPLLVDLTEQIVMASEVANGLNPELGLPYVLHAVNGDPYRSNSILYNTRFGDIPYLTPNATKEKLHHIACFAPGGRLISDGEQLLGSTTANPDEYYVPTLPRTVLKALDARNDMPTYYTEHGTEKAALADLSKYGLSRQGFVLPRILLMVRRYLLRHIGINPPLFAPSNLPIKDSCAGINGSKFTTKFIQSIPGIDELCARCINERWQTITPVMCKKQYCSKVKTRTILGTSNVAALGLRAALSGVTAAFMKKGEDSPIYLGKNKYKAVSGFKYSLCLSADLASCDRSTPAICRWFVTNLLFELANRPDCVDSYVLNCCHDVCATPTLAFTKRGGLSSGDPVTSISNTVYSIIIYAQHMALSFLKERHPLAKSFLTDTLELEDCFKVQPAMIYSDDVVLYAPTFNNYQYWNDHLTLILQFQTDPSKTTISTSPEFLGCTLMGDTPYLVPLRQRVLASLGYNMTATTVFEYYGVAAAILQDAAMRLIFDTDWFVELHHTLYQCAEEDGIKFPSLEFYQSFITRMMHEGSKHCTYCDSSAPVTASCGTRLCFQHMAFHIHCPVRQPYCNHLVGEKLCSRCIFVSSIQPCPIDNLELLYNDSPYAPLEYKYYPSATGLDPGRYVDQHGNVYHCRREYDGVECDGPFPATLARLTTGFDAIRWVRARANALRSVYYLGPAGSGKTRTLLSLIDDQSIIYTPTHRTMLDMIGALHGHCRFTVPNSTFLNFPCPLDVGPEVRLISAGYTPGSGHFVDEAEFSNPLDLLRILSVTPLTVFGDSHQLRPVGFSSRLELLDLMVRKPLTIIYRYGQNIADALSPIYGMRLTSLAPPTQVIYLAEPAAHGEVITPHHATRKVGEVIGHTIDSSQGATFDVCTLHLPLPNSLTLPRLVVGVTRAKSKLYIYDPHFQVKKFITLPEFKNEHAETTELRFTASGQITAIKQWCGKSYCWSDPMPLAVRPYTINPSEEQEKVLRTLYPDLTVVRCEGQLLSPLPRVAHNLGFYFSPDLPNFSPIPEKLAPLWPVVTASNCLSWPDRLVVSLKPLCDLSQPAICAGFYVGESLFIGEPNVASYYLTMFVNSKPQPLPDTLYSTGRFELNARNYLDHEEELIAQQNEHPFIGEDAKSVIGGAHHITSKFLPPVLPSDGVVKVGVASPGKSIKSCCTVTDVYLPHLVKYLDPITPSKVFKVKVDHREYRLMVWRGKTCYFQLECYCPLASASRHILLGSEVKVQFSPNLGPIRTNALVASDPDLYVGWEFDSAPFVLTTSDEPPFGYRLIGGRSFTGAGAGGTAFLYRRTNECQAIWNACGFSIVFRTRPVPARSRNSFMFSMIPGKVVEFDCGTLSISINDGLTR